MSNIDNKIEYAIDLADLDFSHEFEELFKLASLCEEIEELIQSGCEPAPELKQHLFNNLGKFYKANGSFRSEIEKLPLAKQLLQKV